MLEMVIDAVLSTSNQLLRAAWSMDAPAFLVDAAEPLLIVCRQAPSIWANPAFYRLGGWEWTTAIAISAVIDPRDQQRVRNATGLDDGFQRPGQVEVQYMLSGGGSRGVWLH